MLEYGLPETPKPGQRWFIKDSVGGREYRYLHLERKNRLGIWVTVHKQMIHTGRLADPFPAATRQAARDIIRELTVNFNLPTGEVR